MPHPRARARAAPKPLGVAARAKAAGPQVGARVHRPAAEGPQTGVVRIGRGVPLMLLPMASRNSSGVVVVLRRCDDGVVLW